jgi:uncharacterized protein (TIGR02172 family)
MEKGALIGEGRTAQVYAWGDGHILKLYQEWMPAASIEWEFTTTRRVHDSGLPVPAADEILHVDGRMGIVFERIHGVSMLADLVANPGKIIPLSRLLAELHARLHACVLSADAYSQKQQIERAIGLDGSLSEPEKRIILDILGRLPDGNAICHGDFHPDNILMTGHGPVIIDWMTATRGHPLGDVARTALLFQTGGLPAGIAFGRRLVINALRRLIFSTYLKRYLQLHPASRSEIDAWKLPIYAARLMEVQGYPAEKQLILRRIRAGLARLN